MGVASVQELSLFNFDKTPFKIDKPIRLIELFSGIGAQAKALERLGADFKHYRTSEWEVNAAASYKAIHKYEDVTDYSKPYSNDELLDVLFNLGISTDGKKPLTREQISRKTETWKRTVYNNFRATNNVGSIVNVSATDLGIVDTDKYTYICCYSFPCTDLSLAGKQRGMAKGSNTSSSMLWEVERLLNECTELPQVLLMENVTQLHSTGNVQHFAKWIEFLESKGYSNYWKDLNAKNFGIPQNRDRCFMVSILGDYTYEFPEEFPLELRLKDMLEDSVDEKFYISNANVDKILNQHKSIPDNSIIGGMQKNQSVKTDGITTTLTSSMGTGGGYVPMVVGKTDNHAKGGIYSPESVSRTLMATDYKQPMQILEPVRLGGLYDTETSKHQAGAIWDKETIAPTVDTMQGGNRQPLIVANERFFRQALETLAENDCSVGDTIDAFNKRVNKSGTSTIGSTEPTKINLKDGTQITSNDNLVGLRIRKLTPRECFRLQDFDDEDFDRAAECNSDSQLYKQAGNSIAVCCLYYIFKQML